MNGYRVEFYINALVTPASDDPSTLFQVLAAANHRVCILGLDLGIQGNDPSTAPILLDWTVQTTAGTGGDAATVRYRDRGYNEAAESTHLDGPWDAGLQPTSTTVVARMQCHEQGTLIWRPAFPLVVNAGDRLGLRYNGTNYHATSFTVHMAE